MTSSDTPSPGRHQAPALNESAAYASLHGLVDADRALADTLERVSVLATQALGETPEVSLTLIQGDLAWTAATSGPVALDLDKRQYATGRGPCLDAARYSETVKVVMGEPDQPYPEFRQAARRMDVSHTMSIGFSTGAQGVGAMNLYNFTGHPFSVDSERIARTFAVCAGLVLAHVEQFRQAAGRATHLEMALQSRACIEQAKGIVMSRRHCSSEEAFAVLIRLSQAQNVKLRVVAQNLVDAAPAPVDASSTGVVGGVA